MAITRVDEANELAARSCLTVRMDPPLSAMQSSTHVRFLLLLALQASMGALAQTTPTPVITTPINASKAASPKVLLVKPGGKRTQAAGETTFEQKTQWVLEDESARDFLGKNGLHADERAIAAFKTLNPQVRSNGAIPAGSKISIFVPKFAANAGPDVANPASVDMALVAKYSVSGEVARAQQVKMQTLELPASAYLRASDFSTHRQLVSDIDKTAVLVGQRADKMSAKDLALSRYYLASASLSAANLTTVAKLKGVSPDNVAQLQTDVAPVQRMHVLMSAGGPPFEYRRVVVSVTSRLGDKAAPPLRVYVLPGGVLERPETFDDDLIKLLLVHLTFESLTTPAQSTVAQGDMRVWIGPDHQYAAMAKRVREKRPISFTPVRGAFGSQELVLKFNAPEDIVNP